MENSIKETPKYEIGKVKVKNDRIYAEYTERFVDANISNEVTKNCDNIIHPDLRYALSRLKPHVAHLCEMKEASNIDFDNIDDTTLNDTLKNIVITGYSIGGHDESAGVTIVAQRLLSSGKVLNIVTPFQRFDEAENPDAYPYAEMLKEDIDRCDYEVDAYLFENKAGECQLEMDFDGDAVTGEMPVEMPNEVGQEIPA